MRRSLLGVVTCAGVLAISGVARAGEPAPDRFALAWVRAPGAEACASSRDVARLLEQVVGPVLEAPSRATVLIDGIVVPKHGTQGYEVLLRATTVAGELVGERRLESDDARCSEIVRSALLVLTVMIDPDAAARGLPAAVSEELDRREADARAAEQKNREAPASSVVVPQPDLPSDKPETERPAPERAWRAAYAISAGIAVNSKLTPSPGFGVAAAFQAFLSDALAAQIEAAFFPTAFVDVPSPYAAGDVTVTAFELAPELCPLPLALGGLRVSACAGAVVGWRYLGGKGLAYPTNAVRMYAGPDAALSVAFYPTSLGFLEARVQGAWLPADDRFVFTDHDGSRKVLFDPGPWAGYAAVGAGGAF